MSPITMRNLFLVPSRMEKGGFLDLERHHRKATRLSSTSRWIAIVPGPFRDGIRWRAYSGFSMRARRFLDGGLARAVGRSPLASLLAPW
jgi:hypothetical protein